MEPSILSVAQYCGITVRRIGKYYIASCPFHGRDETPSLTFYPSTNSWVCFGKCEGKNGHRNGGGPIQFVEQYYHYSYRDAKEWLDRTFNLLETQQLNVEFPKEEPKKVPHPWVLYWHSLLGEHRSYFRSRGFTDKFIDREMWGWDGNRYTLPVWEGEPGNSEVLGVRRRKVDGQSGEKYIGLANMNPPTVWGRWYCLHKKRVFAFAGEFDACLANQDNFPSFSVVNGINSLLTFPQNWPDLWFPDTQEMIGIFDRSEEAWAARLCSQWNRCKGTMKAKVFHWPLGNYKDYCEFRLKHSVEEFNSLIRLQNL